MNELYYPVAHRLALPAAGEKNSEMGKCSSSEKSPKTRRVPVVRCTLGWAAFSSAICLSKFGNNAKLLEESKPIPINPTLYNFIVQNTINPDPCRHSCRHTHGIACDHSIILGNQIFNGQLTIGQVCAIRGDQSLKPLHATAIIEILRIGMQYVIGVSEFINNGEIAFLPYFLPDTTDNCFVVFFGHIVPF